MEERIIEGWVAMNADEWDIENMSFFATREKAEKCFGRRQKIIRVALNFKEEEAER